MLKNYLACNNYDGAKNYVRELELSEKANSFGLRTGNESLDILLECKKREAV